MAGFTQRLDKINALADVSIGFVWRYRDEGCDMASLCPLVDKNMLFNMSTWQSLDTLCQSVYQSEHLALLMAKKQCCLPMDTPHLALWWVPRGEQPSVAAALARLEQLRAHGPGPQAFTFAPAY